MAERDNVERFAYVYEVEDKELNKTVDRVEDNINSFVGTVTKGFRSVISWTTDTVTALSSIGSRKVTGVLQAVIAPIQGIGTGMEMAYKGATNLVSSLAEGAASTFQLGHRLSTILGTLKVIAKIGGLGVLLGPFLLLIKAFMPFVRVITDTLQPALDLISDTLTAAFAPVSKALYDLAMKLLPHILKIMAPVVAFLVRGIDTLAGFFDEDYFGELTELFDELLPNIEMIVDSFIRDFLKPVSGTLFKTVINLFGSLVKLAVEFVNKIAPYLPKFFSILAKIANLIITSLGDALDDLLKEIVKQLPTLIPAVMELLLAFQKMLPALLKLAPPLLKITTMIVTRLLLPATIKLLDKMLNLFLRLAEKALPLVEIGVENLLDIFDALIEWYERNEDDIIAFWEEHLAKAIEAAGEAVKVVTEYISNLIEDLKEALKLFGIMSEKEKQQEDYAKRTEAQFEAAQANVQLQEAQWRKNEENMVKNLRAAGRSEEFINLQVGLMRARAGAAIEIAKMRARARQDGGYVQRQELAVIAEKEPEWVVPDNPQKIMEFMPRMLRSAMGKSPGVTGTIGAPGGAGGVASPLLGEIRDLLRLIEENTRMDGDDMLLPEVL